MTPTKNNHLHWKLAIVLFFVLAVAACAASPSQEQEATINVGDNSVAEQSQDQDQVSGGAKVEAEVVDDIITKNISGIPVYYFMIGCLVFGMIIPQPRFIRWIF